MSDKFQNKYRIPSTRLQNWDYASEGAYFITICTKDRKHFFGEIENEKIKLSQVGVIADLIWYEIKNHAKNIELGEFVVMPNHIHGILILDNPNNVEKRHAFSLPSEQNIGQQRFQNQGKNTISSIVGSYKSAVTKHAHRLGFEFAWQPSFYDHIIRNAQSFENIQNYISSNQKNWKKDKFYFDQ
jgi:putative transposase